MHRRRGPLGVLLAMLMAAGLMGCGAEAAAAGQAPTRVTADGATAGQLRADHGLRADVRATLMVTPPGTTLDPRTKMHLNDGGVALLLLGSNVVDRSQLIALTRSASCSARGRLLVAVDQELGRAARLTGLITPTPPLDTIVEMADTELHEMATRLGREMAAMGVNVNLAPLIDVVRGPNPVLEGRHLGSDPVEVGRVGAAVIAGLQSQHVVATAKHFPGHGLSRLDPHTSDVTINVEPDELDNIDLAPFRKAIDADVQAVMLGHPVYPAFDADTPAGLSQWALDLLRDDLEFEGVAMTDGIEMEAVASRWNSAEATVLALQAGQDLILLLDGRQVENVVEYVVQAVRSGTLDRDRVAEAAGRVRDLASWAVPIPCGAAITSPVVRD